jgi:hypothetical protein
LNSTHISWYSCHWPSNLYGNHLQIKVYMHAFTEVEVCCMLLK